MDDWEKDLYGDDVFFDIVEKLSDYYGGEIDEQAAGEIRRRLAQVKRQEAVTFFQMRLIQAEEERLARLEKEMTDLRGLAEKASDPLATEEERERLAREFQELKSRLEEEERPEAIHP